MPGVMIRESWRGQFRDWSVVRVGDKFGVGLTPAQQEPVLKLDDPEGQNFQMGDFPDTLPEERAVGLALLRMLLGALVFVNSITADEALDLFGEDGQGFDPEVFAIRMAASMGVEGIKESAKPKDLLDSVVPDKERPT